MADGFQALPDQNAEMTRRTFTVAELDAMFDAKILSRDEKIELIEGEIIQMNSQMMPHGVIKQRLATAISKLLPEDFEVQTELSVQLSEQTLIDPDVAITPRLKIERRYLRANELLLAVEVADTSLHYDITTKATYYARAGVAELWVIDVNGLQTAVHRLPNQVAYTSIVAVPFDSPLKAQALGDAEIIVAKLLT